MRSKKSARASNTDVGKAEDNGEDAQTSNRRVSGRAAATRSTTNARPDDADASAESSLSPDPGAAPRQAISTPQGSGSYGLHPDLIAATSEQYAALGNAVGEAAAAAGSGPMDTSGGQGAGDMSFDYNHSNTSLDQNAYHNFPAHGGDRSQPGTPTGTGEGGAPSSAAAKRREANRLAAARFRTRKKDQVADLEQKVAALESENIGLRAEIQALRLVAASRESGGEVPSYTTLLEAQIEQSEAAAIAAAVAAQAQQSAAAAQLSQQAAAKKKRKTPSMDPLGDAGGDDGTVGKENSRLKEEVSRYETTLEAMHREIQDLRYKVDQQNQQGEPSRGQDESGYIGGGGARGQNGKQDGKSTVAPLQAQYPAGQGYDGHSHLLPGRTSREGSMPLSIPALSPALRISSPGTSGNAAAGSTIPRSSSPLTISSTAGGTTTGKRANWQLNLSGLGSDLGRAGAIRARGMDSPVSAERSGARGADEDDGDESSGARRTDNKKGAGEYFDVQVDDVRGKGEESGAADGKA